MSLSKDFKLALSLSQEKKYSEAISYIEEKFNKIKDTVPETTPDYVKYLSILGDLYLLEEDFEKADSFYSKKQNIMYSTRTGENSYSSDNKKCFSIEKIEEDKLLENIYENIQKSMKCPFCKTVICDIYDIWKLRAGIKEEFHDELFDNAWIMATTSLLECEHVLFYLDWGINPMMNALYFNDDVMDKIFKIYSEIIGREVTEFEWGDNLEDPDLFTAAKKAGYRLRHEELTIYGGEGARSRFGHEVLFFKEMKKNKSKT
jgi:tetratricopeptide (TPR) repeat protein